MKVSKTKNRFKTGFQQPKTDFPKNPVSNPKTRQKNWIGHILRGNSLQREIMEGRMEGKRGGGRPRQKLMDWMMEDGYGKLKEEAQNREKWSHRTSGPARGQRT